MAAILLQALTLVVALFGTARAYELSASSVEECQQLCIDNQPCGSYIFETSYGSTQGTCALHPATTTTIITEPVALGRGVILYNTDIPANNLGMVNVADIQDCSRRCEANPSCNAFAYANNQCWMKSSTGPLKSLNGVTVGIMNRADAKCVILADADSAVSNIDNFPASRDECCDRCVANSACNSFAWNPADSRCWLKSSQGNVFNNPNVNMGFPQIRAGI